MESPGLQNLWHRKTDCLNLKYEIGSEKLKMENVFSLLELLIVIAIIAILTALLLPALKNAKSAAKSAICQSNLKQLGQYYFMYAGDWDDFTPYSYGVDDTLWYSGIASEMPGGSHKYYRYENHVSGTLRKNLDVWNCPENTKQVATMGLTADETQCSYAGNTWNTTEEPFLEGRAFFMKLLQFQWPSDLYVFLDGPYPRIESWKNDGSGCFPSVPTGNSGIRYAHNVGANITFADGHVGYQKYPIMPRGTTTGIGSTISATRWTNGKSWYCRTDE